MKNKETMISFFELGYKNGLSRKEVSFEEAIHSKSEFDVNGCNIDKFKSEYSKGIAVGAKVECSLYCSKMFSQTLRQRKNEKKLLQIIPIDEKFVIGVFQGRLSDYDFIIKYWKYDSEKNSWGYPKQPKHIHWVVDVMIKQEFSPKFIRKFLDSIKSDWDNNVIKHLDSEEERNSFLDLERIYKHLYVEMQKYSSVVARGEYNFEFLIIVAELLMTQERTNYDKAFMFRTLLERLGKQDFYGTISTATQKRK